jgi:hypothetical protein
MSAYGEQFTYIAKENYKTASGDHSFVTSNFPSDHMRLHYCTQHHTTMFQCTRRTFAQIGATPCEKHDSNIFQSNNLIHFVYILYI